MKLIKEAFRDFALAMIVLFIFASCVEVVRADEWTTPEALVYTITVADWLQTRQIRKRDDLEENGIILRPLCGKNPGEACLAAWVGFKLYKLYDINNTHKLRNAKMFNGKIKWKNFVNSLYMGVHVYAVDNGLRLGLKVQW